MCRRVLKVSAFAGRREPQRAVVWCPPISLVRMKAACLHNSVRLSDRCLNQTSGNVGASLVDVFRASQKRSELKVPYVLWVNPQGLFVRVQVKSIVDVLSSPRVKVHIRLEEHAFATFGEVLVGLHSMNSDLLSDLPSRAVRAVQIQCEMKMLG